MDLTNPHIFPSITHTQQKLIKLKKTSIRTSINMGFKTGKMKKNGELWIRIMKNRGNMKEEVISVVFIGIGHGDKIL